MFEIIPCLAIGRGAVWLPPANTDHPISRHPLRLALSLKAEGAATLYLVDLDHIEALPAFAPAVLLGLAHADLRLWVGGGIRTPAVARRLLALGAEQIVVRTLAMERGHLRRLTEAVGAEHVALALDFRSGRLVTDHGQAHREPAAVLAEAEAAGIRRFLISAQTARGNIDFSVLTRWPVEGRQVWAAGGVRSAADLVVLHQAGLQGAIVGRALFQGKLASERSLPSPKGGHRLFARPTPRRPASNDTGQDSDGQPRPQAGGAQ